MPVRKNCFFIVNEHKREMNEYKYDYGICIQIPHTTLPFTDL